MQRSCRFPRPATPRHPVVPPSLSGVSLSGKKARPQSLGLGLGISQTAREEDAAFLRCVARPPQRGGGERGSAAFPPAPRPPRAPLSPRAPRAPAPPAARRRPPREAAEAEQPPGGAGGGGRGVRARNGGPPPPLPLLPPPRSPRRPLRRSSPPFPTPAGRSSWPVGGGPPSGAADGSGSWSR